MNGVIGAISLVSVLSVVASVAKAAAPSLVAGPPQKRGRDLRTYQFDRSSMNAASRRPAVAESNASSAPVTSRTVAFSSLSSQRSRAVLADGGGAGTASPAAPAYSTRNDVVFQYVSSTLRTISAMTPSPMRLVAHGDPDAAKNQRTASAPCASISCIGSSTLPRCLLILRPRSSTTRPRA